MAPDKDINLFDQLKFVTYGHPVSEVAHAAVTMMMLCAVMSTENKTEAKRAIAVFFAEIVKEIERNYDDIRRDCETETVQ